MAARWWNKAWMALAATALAQAAPATAQVQDLKSVDPDAAIDADLRGAPTAPAPAAAAPAPAPAAAPRAPGTPPPPETFPVAAPATAPVAATTTPVPAASNTFRKEDLMGAGESVFGKGTVGLADVIEDLLKKQGEPNGYIVGREGSGAFMFGLRWGSGTLHHRVEGQKPVYWTGPSLGIDAGASGGNALILVYNLYDTADLYHRFGAGEGQAYLLAGFHVSYLRRGDVVLIPVRMGAGLRLGANVGYLRFSQKQKVLPF